MKYFFLAFIFGLTGLGIIGYQVFYWLKEGIWKGISILYPFYNFWDWAFSPTEWIGLHKILDGFSLSILFIMLGALFGYLSAENEYLPFDESLKNM